MNKAMNTRRFSGRKPVQYQQQNRSFQKRAAPGAGGLPAGKSVTNNTAGALSLEKDFKLASQIDGGMVSYKLYKPLTERAVRSFSEKGKAAVLTLCTTEGEKSIRSFRKDENIEDALKPYRETARKSKELEEMLNKAFLSIKSAVARLSSPLPEGSACR